MKTTKKPIAARAAVCATLCNAVGALCAAALSISTAHAQAVEKVTFGWPAANAITLAHVQFGKDLGFFRDEKIDVEVVPMKGSFPIIQQILTGNMTTGYVGVDSIVLSRQPGKEPLPMRFFYNYLRSSIWEIVVLADSPLKTINDLKGKSLGVAGMQYGNIPVTKALLGKAGFKPEDINLQTVGTDAPAYRALTTRQIDALNLWDTLHATLEAEGTALRRLPFPPEITETSSHGFPVSETTLKTKPDMLMRFGRAWAKSTIACSANPTACVYSFWRAYPAQKPSTGTEEQKLAREQKILVARLQKLTAFRANEKKLYGSYSDTDWQNIINTLKLGGTITKTDIPFSDLYTNELVPGINNFDVDAVVRAAKAVAVPVVKN
jgi:NitT/TauT family transport system substrate-binding protein